jgi:hypothetical protein
LRSAPSTGGSAATGQPLFADAIGTTFPVVNANSLRAKISPSLIDSILFDPVLIAIRL